MAVQLLNDDDTFVVTDADLIEDGDPKTVYTLRHLTTQKHRAFMKRHTRGTRRTGEEKVNGDALTDDILKWVLVNWTGVVDRGQPVPCTDDYKLMLDSARKGLIIMKAGLSEIVAAEDARGETFRPTP